MFFTVQVTQARVPRWRLQIDGQWRPLEGDLRVLSGDKRFFDVSQVDPYLRPNQKLVLGHHLVTLNPTDIGLTELSRVYFVTATAHRITPPQVPAKHGLRTVIREGSDRRARVLVLTLEGRFELWDRSSDEVVETAALAARTETFDEGSTEVGPATAENEEQINRLYGIFLEAWIEHLKTGAVNIFRDDWPSKAEAELVREAERSALEAVDRDSACSQ